MMASVLPLVWKSDVRMLSRHRLPDVIYFGAYDCRSVNKKYDDGKCIASGMEIGGTDVVQTQAPGCRLFRGLLPDVVYFGACDCRSVNKKYDDGKCIASGMEIAGTDVVQTQAPGCRLFRGS
ncbi:hypothetical protein J6590_019947 [Homalodisca vitripennis]|nr:hypothetical protein J6590_019947 [Homalodisca vitripennis]